MKFYLIDKIEQISDERIVAVKYVSLAEEYLADHFPTFPVLPGVMMLEALVQAATWLLHRRSGFGKPIAVLKEARNVKYGTFVAPGNSLRVEVDYFKPADHGGATFKATGFVGERQAVSARIEMSYFSLAEKNPDLGVLDAKLTEHNKARWGVLNVKENKDPQMTHEEVYNKVKAVLVDALGVDDEEVTPEASLRSDLGAESIDFLDILFRLEKTFTIDPAKPFKIPRGEMFPEDVFNNPEFVDGGKVTAKGLEELKKLIPHADLSMLQPGDDIEKMQFTVSTIVKYIESKLKQQE